MNKYRNTVLVTHAITSLAAIVATTILAVYHVIDPASAIPALLALAGVTGGGMAVGARLSDPVDTGSTPQRKGK